MAYVKTTWVDEVTPTSAANLNKMEQGIADAHEFGVPASQAFTNVGQFDFAGLADDSIYELVTKVKLTATNPANQPNIYLLANAIANGGRSISKRAYKNTGDGVVEDIDGSPLNDYGIYLGGMDFNSNGHFISRHVFYRDVAEGQFLATGHSVYRPTAVNFAVIERLTSGFLNVATALASVRVVVANNPGTLTGRAILRKVG